MQAIERRSKMEERTGAVTMKGNPLTLVGRTPQPGDAAIFPQCYKNPYYQVL